MKKWTVYTQSGIWANIWARNAYDAKYQVYTMTLGRVKLNEMTAERAA